MYLLESNVQVEQILEGLLRALPPVQQLRHLAAHVLGRACLHFADDIVKALVVADGKPLLAASATDMYFIRNLLAKLSTR